MVELSTGAIAKIKLDTQYVHPDGLIVKVRRFSAGSCLVDMHATMPSETVTCTLGPGQGQVEYAIGLCWCRYPFRCSRTQCIAGLKPGAHPKQPLTGIVTL